MKISIVVPSYNHADFLDDCLGSIFSQHEEDGRELDLEVIVMDGGSTDGSVEIIRKYEDRLAYWVSAPDGGQTNALVEGFRHTTGDIMCWLNSDDFYMPGALAKIINYMNANPAVDVVYGDMIWVETNGKLIKVQKEMEFDLDVLLWVYDYIPQPSTFWRRGIWEKSGGLNPGRVCAMDYDLWARFVKAGGVIRHMDGVLSAMRRYPEQKNQRLRKVSDAEDREILENFIGRRAGAVERSVKKVVHKARRIAKRATQGAYF